MIILYHRAHKETAHKIRHYVFPDATWGSEDGSELTGVWFSNVDIRPGSRSRCDVLLEARFRLTEDEIAKYEFFEEGQPHRRWCIPASLANRADVFEVDQRNFEYVNRDSEQILRTDIGFPHAVAYTSKGPRYASYKAERPWTRAQAEATRRKERRTPIAVLAAWVITMFAVLIWAVSRE